MAIDVSDTRALDDDLQLLSAHKDQWANLPIAQKIYYLEQFIPNLVRVMPEWVEIAAKAKGIPSDSPLVGEEWIGGPWATLHNIRGLLDTLRALVKGDYRRPPHLRTRPNGQVIATVAPNKLMDYILFSGYRTEVWMQPDVTLDNFYEHVASFYKQKTPQGKVILILGAGNIASIPTMDVLYKMFAEGGVVIVKPNPVNDYLVPFYEAVFAPIIRDGYLRFAHGGAEIGAYLVDHEFVDEIHITGSIATHDRIVFGAGEEGAARKARNEPRLQKRITSELGGVSPVIVVPGPWSHADMRFHAENIATIKMHNGGFNCVAAQVLILASDWPQKDDFLHILRDVLRTAPKVSPYYPGAAERHAKMLEAHPNAELLDNYPVPTTLITQVDADSDDICFSLECFGSVLSVTELSGGNASEFLRRAVRFANDKLHGTLGANIFVHPRTQRELGKTFEDALAELRYGAIGVNGWSAMCFLNSEASWGAYPGSTLSDPQSGIGVVHNTFLFDKPQKSVAYAPFYPYPRNLWHGEFHWSPKPAWFITNKQEHNLGRRFAYYEVDYSARHLPGLFMDALRG